MKPCCERCGQPLDPERVVWLEFDQRTNKYVDPEKVRVPPQKSQGIFPFGPDCARHPNRPYTGR